MLVDFIYRGDLILVVSRIYFVELSDDLRGRLSFLVKLICIASRFSFAWSNCFAWTIYTFPGLFSDCVGCFRSRWTKFYLLGWIPNCMGIFRYFLGASRL
jgi:hypothetical protein